MPGPIVGLQQRQRATQGRFGRNMEMIVSKAVPDIRTSEMHSMSLTPAAPSFLGIGS